MSKSPIPPLPDGRSQDAWRHYEGVDFKITVVLTDQTNVALLLEKLSELIAATEPAQWLVKKTEEEMARKPLATGDRYYYGHEGTPPIVRFEATAYKGKRLIQAYREGGQYPEVSFPFEQAAPILEQNLGITVGADLYLEGRFKMAVELEGLRTGKDGEKKEGTYPNHFWQKLLKVVRL